MSYKGVFSYTRMHTSPTTILPKTIIPKLLNWIDNVCIIYWKAKKDTSITFTFVHALFFQSLLFSSPIYLPIFICWDFQVKHYINPLIFCYECPLFSCSKLSWLCFWLLYSCLLRVSLWDLTFPLLFLFLVYGLIFLDIYSLNFLRRACEKFSFESLHDCISIKIWHEWLSIKF